VGGGGGGGEGGDGVSELWRLANCGAELYVAIKTVYSRIGGWISTFRCNCLEPLDP